MTEAVTEVDKPFDSFCMLSLTAKLFAESDDLFWTLKNTFSDRMPTPMERAHLNRVREERKQYYANLVEWAKRCERERIEATS